MYLCIRVNPKTVFEPWTNSRHCPFEPNKALKPQQLDQNQQSEMKRTLIIKVDQLYEYTLKRELYC